LFTNNILEKIVIFLYLFCVLLILMDYITDLPYEILINIMIFCPYNLYFGSVNVTKYYLQFRVIPFGNISLNKTFQIDQSINGLIDK